MGRESQGDLALKVACRTAQSDPANMLIQGRFLKGSRVKKAPQKAPSEGPEISPENGLG
jgi:hypothetical protein